MPRRKKVSKEERNIWKVGIYCRLSSGVRIDIWTHFMRGCIIDYVH